MNKGTIVEIFQGPAPCPTPFMCSKDRGQRRTSLFISSRRRCRPLRVAVHKRQGEMSTPAQCHSYAIGTEVSTAQRRSYPARRGIGACATPLICNRNRGEHCTTLFISDAEAFRHLSRVLRTRCAGVSSPAAGSAHQVRRVSSPARVCAHQMRGGLVTCRGFPAPSARETSACRELCAPGVPGFRQLPPFVSTRQTPTCEGHPIEPLQGSGLESAATQGGASLTLGFVIEPRWGTGGEVLLKTGRLHNTYEAPAVKRQNVPYGKNLMFFRSNSYRHRQAPTHSGRSLLSFRLAQVLSAPNTYSGSAVAERRCCDRRSPRPRNSSVPSYRPIRRADSRREGGPLRSFSYYWVRVRGRQASVLFQVGSWVQIEGQERVSNQCEWLPGTWLWTYWAVEAAFVRYHGLPRSGAARPLRLQLCGWLTHTCPQTFTNWASLKGCLLCNMK